MKNRRKLLLYFLPILLLMTALILLLTSRLRFLRFCDNLFLEEMKSNALTLHYTLSDENAYGIETGELTLGSFEKNLSEEKRWLNKKLLLLKTISEKVLPFDLQMEYDTARRIGAGLSVKYDFWKGMYVKASGRWLHGFGLKHMTGADRMEAEMAVGYRF